jgi:hypothetical protein
MYYDDKSQKISDKQFEKHVSQTPGSKMHFSFLGMCKAVSHLTPV